MGRREKGEKEAEVLRLVRLAEGLSPAVQWEREVASAAAEWAGLICSGGGKSATRFIFIAQMNK